jgi:HD-GYP domain-containing protein (c-di-GMP phosphodiesterase class II)/GGDEF domain-containing protein
VNPRLRKYGVVIGGAFWIAFAVEAALNPEAFGSFSRMAPLIAIALVGEELMVRQREDGGAAISFSAAAHVAAALLLDPLAAAATAVLGLVISDGLRSDGRRFLLINSAMFGGSTWIAALVARTLMAGHGLKLVDVPAFALVLTVRYAVTTTIFCGGVAVAGGGSFLPLFKDSGLEELNSALGEGSLGVLIAIGLSGNLEVLPFLLPLFGALYASKANLERLRSETQHALNAMADVIDARDPSTAAHTERVAGYVERFTEALRLPPRESERLVAAARYHDLGKIAVDVRTLTSGERLAPDEILQIREHPRLSAKLLRPFSFAREMAEFAELHHERYDGAGYYAVDRAQIPIESHVLIVADSIDAMTSTRAYRPALTLAEALDELADKAGSHFHPLVARAFTAILSGESLEERLSTAEIAELTAQFHRLPMIPRSLPIRRGPRTSLLLSLLLALALAALHAPSWALTAPLVIAVASVLAWAATQVQRRHHRRRIEFALAATIPADAVIVAAGFHGRAGWLPIDPNVAPIAAPLLEGRELDEAKSHARRRDDNRIAALSTGAIVVFSGVAKNGYHFIVVLSERPRRHKLEPAKQLTAALAAAADPPPTSHPQQDRRHEASRRATLRVQLNAFDRIRCGAGQLVAERVIADAEQQLRTLLRTEDALIRNGDDQFLISALVVDEGALTRLERRIHDAVAKVSLPVRLDPLSPRILATLTDNAAHAAYQSALEAGTLTILDSQPQLG